MPFAPIDLLLYNWNEHKLFHTEFLNAHSNLECRRRGVYDGNEVQISGDSKGYFKWVSKCNTRKNNDASSECKCYVINSEPREDTRQQAIAKVIGLLNCIHPSSRTTALGWTQPLTEMSIRNLTGGKERPVRKADSLTAIYCLEDGEVPKSHKRMGLHGLLQGYSCFKKPEDFFLQFFRFF
jgi:hypothetical protein